MLEHRRTVRRGEGKVKFITIICVVLISVFPMPCVVLVIQYSNFTEDRVGKDTS